MALSKKSYAFPVMVGIIGVFVLLLITRHGIGIWVDSVVYIGGALNLLSGNGYTNYILSANHGGIPITRFPPLYSMVLAFLGLLHITPVVGARLLNSLLFGCNILLAGLVVNRETQGSIWLSIISSILILTSTKMLWTHSFALTEPMFIFFSIMGLYLLCLYIENYKRILFIYSAFFIAMSLLTRYAGIAPLIAGIIGILLLRKENWYTNILDASIYFVISILPISIWLIRNKYYYSDLVGRPFVYHPVGIETFKEFILVFSGWLCPFLKMTDYVAFISMAFFLILIIITIYMIKYNNVAAFNELKPALPTIPIMYFIYLLVYIIFIIFSKSFYDAAIPIDNRILAPLFIPFFMVLLYIVYKIMTYHKSVTFIRYAIIVICVLYAAVYVDHGVRYAVKAQQDSIGYSSISWKNSEILNYISKEPLGRIYSNAWEAIYIIAHKRSYLLPFLYDSSTLEKNERYLDDVDLLKRHLENKDTVVVWLDKFSQKNICPRKKNLKKNYISR